MQATPSRGVGGPPAPHPRLRVSNQDRDQVIEQLKAAFAEGRLDKDEMDERLDRAMNARTYGELAPITWDLHPAAYAPGPAPAPRSASSYAPPYVGAPDGSERLGAAAAHLLPLFGLVIIGPLLMLLTMGRTSPYVRRHAVEALNFHITLVGASIVLPLTIIGVALIPVIWVAAVVLSIVGGLSALGDGGFRYPLTLRPFK
ncbi:DUF1707 and DUF4870 domain-containing protein [Thermopolyspora sp. NPDC052614]|uniref:DUF1707 and DUF4870 domain-containing protein n=1 Tax=Thermopolyspora sp. NPDC052614 TaxID=3155682 RepID=UPI0034121C3A